MPDIGDKVIPQGWVEVPLEQCVDILDSQRVPVNNTERASRIDGKLQSELFPYYGATGQVGYIDDYLFDEELVALGEDGVPFLDPLKAKAYMLFGKTWVNNHAHVLKGANSDINNKLLYHYLNQVDYHGYVNGATRLKLTQGNMKKLPIRLAPAAEQTRIANKLDELLAQVDTIKARVDAIPEILKRFRQSVLAAAVSGRLTEDWASENGLKEWSTKRLGDCFECIDGDRGPNYPKKTDYHDEGHCLFLSTKNVRKFGFVFSSQVFITKEKDQQLRKGRLRRGDLVITTRGTLGHIASFDEKVKADIIRINSGMLILRKMDVEYVSDYFKLLFASPGFQKEIDERRTGSAQPQLPAKILKDFELPIPQTEEQREIARCVDQHFSFADQIELRVKDAQSHINNLTQSILAKAFRGELVPQNPDDEPASILLERIQAERDAATNLVMEVKKKQKSKSTRRGII